MSSHGLLYLAPPQKDIPIKLSSTSESIFLVKEINNLEQHATVNQPIRPFAFTIAQGKPGPPDLCDLSVSLSHEICEIGYHPMPNGQRYYCSVKSDNGREMVVGVNNLQFTKAGVYQLDVSLHSWDGEAVIFHGSAPFAKIQVRL